MTKVINDDILIFMIEMEPVEPVAATPFEARFGLEPLGDDLTARLERAEHLLSVLLGPILDPHNEGRRESVLGHGVQLPSPKERDVQEVLTVYRTDAANQKRRAVQRARDEQDFWDNVE